MHLIDGNLIFSATDLSDFLACPHLTRLNLRRTRGGPGPPRYDDPSLEVLRARGLEHEQRWLEQQKATGTIRVVEITDAPGLSGAARWQSPADATAQAMRDGADLIYQGVLFDGAFVGKPDFLRRVERPGAFGAWSYEIVDTKLAREAKGGALLQLLLYAELLRGVQGALPEHVHLALGGPEARTHGFRTAEYMAYFRSIRERFLAWIAAAPADVPRAPEPVQHCDTCDWDPVCKQERREADHLALVAGITRHQRRGLVEHGITTLEGLATTALPMDPRPDGIGRTALERIHGQARIQLAGRRASALRHEILLPITPPHGLAALPAPSPGDLFFDLEGDPFALTHGIEYLFGYADAQGTYTAHWALDRTHERRAFESFIDLVMERLRTHPDLHVYHYAPYEPTALKRLMGRYATREDEVDELLRGGVFIDLYRVVRHALRASVESYSIKKLEPFYGFSRDVDLRSASRALSSFEAWLALGGDDDARDRLLTEIEGYNKDDCVSTLRLRDWLESLRTAAEHAGESIPRPTPESREPGEEVSRRNAEVDAVMGALASDVPDDPDARTPEQHARWLLAQMLEFHRREKKTMWWEYFRRIALSDEELIEDRATLGGLESIGIVDTVKRSHVHRYRFPQQEHDLEIGKTPVDPATQDSGGTIVAIDEAACTIDLRRGKSNPAPHPRALIPFENFDERPMSESLLRLARATIAHGFAPAHPHRAALDLLTRTPPRLVRSPADAPLVQEGEPLLDAAIRLVHALDDSVLPIQGPPGAGKTYTAARMIVRAIEAGRRVGITATSHKVITNLLDETCKAAVEMGVDIQAIQKCDLEDASTKPQVKASDDNDEVRDALASGDRQLAAGTSWLWSRPDMTGSVDVLFIDEAGQFALANALAVAPAARNLVLLGDPRQLEQPQQGTHPPGSGVSVLEHILGDAATMPEGRGLFLDRTWRLHPDICAFTSDAFYAGRLHARPGLDGQRITGPPPWAGAGLRIVTVEHAGNDNESPEEVEAIARIMDGILGDTLAQAGASNARCTWTKSDGETRPITLADILVVAPYNAQVAALTRRLPAGARIGTVDRFQGQEAPIVIYSMTSSSVEDAPRGMAFLYSLNRLNVATSRARCLVILVASPDLFVPECRTPEQMRLANAICLFRERGQPA